MAGGTRGVVVMSMMVATASVLHVVESWLPLPFPVPGAKLGLANIVTLVALLWWGRNTALLIAVARVMLGSLFGGMLFGPAFAMALAGAIGSLLVMDTVRLFAAQRFSPVGLSVLGAAAHSVIQLVVAAVLVDSVGVLAYLPWLTLFAVPTGLFTGLVALSFMRHLRYAV